MAARSTKVVFHNETLFYLRKIEESLAWGIWSGGMEAPDEIAPQTTIAWQSESDGFGTGTEGRIRYEIEGAPHPHGEVYVHWDNPYSGSNSYHQTTYPNFEVFHEGGVGDNATVDFFFRESQPHFAPFTPSVHGFKFVNNWPDSGIKVEPSGIEVAINAMCGGMVYAALDYYYAGRVIPTNTSPPGSTDPWLYIYIVDRLFDSFTTNNVLSFMQYMAPWYPDTDTGLGDGYSTVMVEQQFPAIRRQILNGSPVPLGLIMVKSYLPFDLGHNHQVLVRGYQQSGQDVTLWLYDPNTPQETADSAYLKFNTSTLSTPIQVEKNVAADGPVYCFFGLEYSSKPPPPGRPFSLRTYEQSHHHPLGTGLRGYRPDGNLITNLRMLV